MRIKVAMRNKIILIFILLFCFKVQIFGQVQSASKTLSHFNDSIAKLTIQKKYEFLISEATPDVYMLLYKRLSSDSILELCDNKNFLIEVFIEVKDTIITSCTSTIFEFDKKGENILDKNGFDYLSSLFIGERAKFKFVEGFKGFYHFKLLQSNLCNL